MINVFNSDLSKGILVILTMFLTGARECCAQLREEAEGESEEHRKWAFETGVSFITDSDIQNILLGEFDPADGPAGGQIYSFTVSRRLGELEWDIGGHTFRPQLELPLTLEVVDENGRSPFLDYNGAFMIRWVDFPWNRYVRTSMAMGIGLSYSEEIYLMDIERHPDRDRSHLKFHWPMQIVLSAPKYPEHQIKFFISHQSGGHFFDEGGVNSIGIGYRFGF